MSSEVYLVFYTFRFVFVQVLLNVPSIHNSDDAIQSQLLGQIFILKNSKILVSAQSAWLSSGVAVSMSFGMPCAS